MNTNEVYKGYVIAWQELPVTGVDLGCQHPLRRFPPICQDGNPGLKGHRWSDPC